ncbi:MAG: UMP kinase [Candidatus Moranbacteria bacterium]|nr:UMP kinase [Candidatus Moranbacteria bacterium]
MDNKKIVMSLGGSLIVPEGIDTKFVKSFISFIKEYVEKGYSFMLITGGGRLARVYGDALKDVIQPSNFELDLLGISITKTNAEFIKICLGDLAYESIVQDPDVIPKTKKPVLVGGGWKPGNSSDLAAVHAAKSLGAKRVINLTNIDYVYDSDPNKNVNAKPIENISWVDFLLLFPDNNWVPGANRPFDPIASCEAQNDGQEVVIINGKNLENLGACIEGKKFVGTVIK